jgi:twinkle protein
MMILAEELSERLSQRAEDFARFIFPNGKKSGNEWCIGSVQGDAGSSLKIHLKGSKSGVWCDFATGESGDLLDLWARKEGVSLLEAMKGVKAYLGIKDVKFQPDRKANYIIPKKQVVATIPTSSKVFDYLTKERGLTQATLKAFHIGDESDQIVFPYIRDGKIINLKYLKIERPNGKKEIRSEKNCEPCLFGWQTIPKNAREIAICEGEIDAMTLYQYGIPALSVPFGAGSGSKNEWVENDFDRLAVFDVIYVCMDDDDAGHEAQKSIIHRLGNVRCRVMTLPMKDANDCLQNGYEADDIKECLKASKSIDPHELRRASEYLQQILDRFYPPDGKLAGYESAWEKSRDKIRFRPSELSVWTGINGHGKTQFLGHLMLGLMNQGARVCIASLELKPSLLLSRLTRQCTGMELPAKEYIEQVTQWFYDKLWIFDLTGTAKAQRLIEVFIYARQRYGIDTFVIDSFAKLDMADDDYKGQKVLMNALCDFKNEYDCHVHLVVHPRKGSDETAMPGKLDTKGSGCITDLADNCFTVWRNKAKEAIINKANKNEPITDKEQEKLLMPDALWCCDKQRDGDWEGKFSFWYHAPSFQYLSYEKQKPQRIVQYSCLNP